MQAIMSAKLPFHRRMLLLVACVTGGSLLLFFTLSLTGLFFFLRHGVVEKLGTVSDLLAVQAIVELSRNQSNDISGNIYAELKNEPDIDTAVFYAADNRPMFSYVKPGISLENVLPGDLNLAGMGERFFFKDGKIKVQMVRPVGYGEQGHGTLFLLLDTASLVGRFGTLLIFLILGMAMCLGLALLVAARLQKQISEPIYSLSETLAKISRRGDYSRRLQPAATDNLAELAETINVLLERLQHREEQLREHNRNLEALLEKRSEEIHRQYEQMAAAALEGNNNMARQFAGKALLVDDEPISRKIMAALLSRIGLLPEVAESGIEALGKLAADSYSLVLMDINMPAMNGLETTAKIRALEKKEGRQRATIIALSAHVVEMTRRQCLAAGMDVVLVKPIEPETLIACIVSSLWPEKDEKSQPPTEDGEELWNLVRALEFVGGDEQLFYEIATVFLDRNDLLLQNIATAIEHGDADDLLESAHAYRGAIGHFASQLLRRSAKALEEMARSGRIDGVDIHLARLRENSGLLCRELAQLIIEAKDC